MYIADQEKLVDEVPLKLIPGDGKPIFGGKLFIRTARFPLSAKLLVDNI